VLHLIFEISFFFLAKKTFFFVLWFFNWYFRRKNLKQACERFSVSLFSFLGCWWPLFLFNFRLSVQYVELSRERRTFTKLDFSFLRTQKKRNFIVFFLTKLMAEFKPLYRCNVGRLGRILWGFNPSLPPPSPFAASLGQFWQLAVSPDLLAPFSFHNMASAAGESYILFGCMFRSV